LGGKNPQKIGWEAWIQEQQIQKANKTDEILAFSST